MITNKNIHNVIEDNMSDYSAYVVLNRAIPDLRDATKPVHKRIIYAMYKEGATKFMKSATMSGKVMAYHPHADTYPTMVGMVQKDGQLLPWLVGKGNFSQHTSRDLKYGSSRYTEVKLSNFTIDVLKDLNNHSIDFVPNYDGTKMMPEVLPVKFPTILHYCQSGIGVGMASNIPSFNMRELSEAIEKYINSGEKTMLIPDFVTGGSIVLNKNEIAKINKLGRGNIRLRAKYKVYDNKIIINEIPYTTSREAIIESVINLIKDDKIREIINIKDTTDLQGMSITITCKKNIDTGNLMNKLYMMTPLESTFSANMNVICDKLPKVMGAWNIIDKWLEWRKGCIIRSYNYEINELKKKQHLYEAFIKIIDCIDEVIDIIRISSEDKIIQNLVNKLQIDKEQAEYISEVKLRNLNHIYIQKKINEIEKINQDIKDKFEFINDENNISQTIIRDIKGVTKKYGQPRKTNIIEDNVSIKINKEDLVEDYNCRILYTKNYIKKHMKQSENHKLKEDEIILGDITTTNKSNLLIFTNKANRYKVPVHILDTLSPASYGQFIRSIIELESDEEIIKIVSVEDNKGYIVSVYENGKVSKAKVDSFLSNNKKLLNCYNTESKLIDIDYIIKDKDIFLLSDEGKALIFNTERISAKGSRHSRGNVGIKLNEGFKCIYAVIDVTKEDRFTLITKKGKERLVMLDDVSNREDIDWLTYLTGRNGNQGNFIYNTRLSNDLIVNVREEK